MYRPLWLAQAFSGILLILLAGAHMLANHTEEGMLDYQQAVARFQDPVIFAIEVAFLLLALFHAVVGLRSVLADFVRSPRVQRWLGPGLATLGVAAGAYGLWLAVVLRLR